MKTPGHNTGEHVRAAFQEMRRAGIALGKTTGFERAVMEVTFLQAATRWRTLYNLSRAFHEVDKAIRLPPPEETALRWKQAGHLKFMEERWRKSSIATDTERASPSKRRKRSRRP
jgi:hypothetical protein